MARFSVALKTSARKELKALDDVLLERIITKLDELSDEPRPAGCKKLKGAQDLWRIRVGDYRIVYAIDDKSHHIDITRIRHRRDVYER